MNIEDIKKILNTPISSTGDASEEFTVCDFKSEEIKEIFRTESIVYDGDYTVDSLVDYMRQEHVLGNEVKNILKALNIFDKKIKSKEQNIEYFINKVTIDGVASSKYKGLPIQSQSEEKKVTENSESNKTCPKNIEEKSVEVFTSLEDAQQFFDSISNNVIDAVEQGLYFDASTDNEIYNLIGVSVNDGISLSTDQNLCHSLCLLVSNDNKVVLSGNFIKNDSTYTILASKDFIDYDEMKNNTRFRIISASVDIKSFYSSEIDILVKDMEYTDKVLCIDFGTCNTVMGTYDADSIKLVEYSDVTTPEYKSSNIYPTIVYVKRCNPDNNKVKYLYGYEAKKVLLESDYNPKGSMYFEIKRWITSLDKVETIIDENGVKIEVERRQILKKYIRHLLITANIYFKTCFKKIHFSAPVQLKNKFIDFLQKEVFNGDGFESIEVMNANETIDEGVAIIYKHISERIKASDRKGETSKSENILIVDCGGGTTDLASCEYKYKKTDTGYDLKINTTAENGNSNFGGNNITYRIFQLLKIKLTEYYTSKNNANQIEIDLSELLDFNENDILNIVDNCVNNQTKLSIYDKLNLKSAQCEEILPTDYNGKIKYAHSKITKSQTVRNFNYLWQLAEKIKIEFFSRTDLVSIDFNKPTDKNIVVSSDANLYFYIKNMDKDVPPLIKTGGVPDIEINTKEITALLKPEIYYLLASIFKINANTDINLDSYRIIKFSGQSCKIGLFQELLKEFVAGKKLRNSDSESSAKKGAAALKLECIEGSISYIRDKENHMIDPYIEPRIPNLTYEIRVSRGEGMEGKILIDGKNFTQKGDKHFALPVYIDQHTVAPGDLNVIISNIIGEKKEYHLTDKINSEIKEENKILLDDLRKEIQEKSYISKYTEAASAKNLLDKLIEDIRNIEPGNGNSRILVFAVPNYDGYGFILYQIVVSSKDSKKKYYMNSSNVYMFEEGVSSKTFFSGDNCSEYM